MKKIIFIQTFPDRNPFIATTVPSTKEDQPGVFTETSLLSEKEGKHLKTYFENLNNYFVKKK